jgi:hypothetical protein
LNVIASIDNPKARLCIFMGWFSAPELTPNEAAADILFDGRGRELNTADFGRDDVINRRTDQGEQEADYAVEHGQQEQEEFRERAGRHGEEHYQHEGNGTNEVQRSQHFRGLQWTDIGYLLFHVQPWK